MQVGDRKEEQGLKRAKTVEVARQQWKGLVVGVYIYEEDQSHEVCYLRDVFKNVLREDLSSLNFS